jgi:hypothetical protein
MAKAKNPVVKTLKDYQRLFLSEIGKGIKKYDIAASGDLGKSFRVGQPRVKMLGSTYMMKIESLPYWYWINYGRGKTKKGEGGELKSRLEEWLRLPNVRQKVTSGGKGKYEGGSDDKWDDKKIENVAQLMANKIHARGIKAKPFVTEAREKLDERMYKDIATASAEMVELKLSEIITFINSKKD